MYLSLVSCTISVSIFCFALQTYEEYFIQAPFFGKRKEKRQNEGQKSNPSDLPMALHRASSFSNSSSILLVLSMNLSVSSNSCYVCRRKAMRSGCYNSVILCEINCNNCNKLQQSRETEKVICTKNYLSNAQKPCCVFASPKPKPTIENDAKIRPSSTLHWTKADATHAQLRYTLDSPSIHPTDFGHTG